MAIQEVQRIFLQRPRHGLDGFRDAADRQQIVIAIPKAHVAGDRLARHRKPPLAFRADPVVPEAASAHTEQRVRLGQRGIDAQRLFFSRTRQRHHFVRRLETQVRQHRVAAAQQAVRKRELRVERDGVLEQWPWSARTIPETPWTRGLEP